MPATASCSTTRAPRRGETFVTRKITRGLANIAQGLEHCLYLGNMDALRDWGHAKDYVRMQWMMLQQDQPEDFVIATGVQYSVREFVRWSAAELGIEPALRRRRAWRKHAIVDRHRRRQGPGAAGRRRASCAVDPRYFRPAEVETLLGDPTKAKERLGWVPEITVAGNVRRDGRRGPRRSPGATPCSRPMATTCPCAVED